MSDVTTSTRKISREQMLSISEAFSQSYQMKIDDEMDGKKLISIALSNPNLTDRERLVIQMRYGVNGAPENTLDECGVAMDVSRERVRQIEMKALRKIREYMNEDGEVMPKQKMRAKVAHKLEMNGFDPAYAARVVSYYFDKVTDEYPYMCSEYIAKEIIEIESRKYQRV